MQSEEESSAGENWSGGRWIRSRREDLGLVHEQRSMVDRKPVGGK